MKLVSLLGTTATAAALTLLPGFASAAFTLDALTAKTENSATALGQTIAQSSTDDDGTPDQGPGDNGVRGRDRNGSDDCDHSGGNGHDGGSHDGGGHGGGHGGGGLGGDDGGGHGGHGGDHASLLHHVLQPPQAFEASGDSAMDPAFETARRGRSKPRIPGGSGCDDPKDMIEHPECRG